MRRKGQQAENDKTERLTGLGRRLRQEIAKWNQMTALTFQTGGETSNIPGLHETPADVSHTGNPSVMKKAYRNTAVALFRVVI